MPFCCGKPGGKSGKPHGKLALFFTKTVENPVEKVKSSFQTGNSIHFPVVLLCRKIRLTAVFLGGRCGSFPHCAETGNLKGDTLFQKRVSPFKSPERNFTLAVCSSKSCTRCAIRCGVHGFAMNPYRLVTTLNRALLP